MRNRKKREVRTPSVLVAAWPKTNQRPDESMLQYLWGAVYNRHYTAVVYSGQGTRDLCFTNVARKILEDGGDAVIGWALQAGRKRNGQENYLAGMSVVIHYVWRSPDGQLLDVTDGYDDACFVHNPWGLVSNGCYRFMDHMGLIRPNKVPGVCSMAVRLQRKPECTPLPIKPVDGRTLALRIRDWRVSDDPSVQAEHVAIMDRLLAAIPEQPVPV